MANNTLASNSITSTDAVLMLAVPPLYVSPQRIQGFMADRAFDTEAADIAEIVMGVDGGISAGFIPYLTMMSISIMPNSASSLFFENWMEAEKVAYEKLFATGTVAFPSIKRKYTLARGILTRAPPIAGAARVLEGRQFSITWGDITPATFG